MKIIEKLDGYKTYIGGLLIAIGAFLKTTGQIEYGMALTQLGEAFAVVGLGHKLAKREA